MVIGQERKAVFYGLLAFLLLSVMDALIKVMSAEHSAVTVSFARFASAGILSAVVWFIFGRPKISLALAGVHSLRGALQAVSMVLFALSLANLKFLEAMSIAFLAPLMIPVMSALILKEGLKLQAMAQAVMGFMGACLTGVGAASTPLTNASPALGTITAVSAAVTYALSIVLLKGRALTDGPVVSGVFSSCIPAALIAPFLLIWGDPVDLNDMATSLWLGILSTGAMALLTLAYGLSETQRIAPLEYTAVVWAGLLGLFIFKEVPNAYALAGCAIILGTCLWSVSSTLPEKQC